MKIETFKVGGMTCGGCVSAVTKALKVVDGVKDVAVSLTREQATIEFDETASTPQRLRAAVDRAGFDVADQNAAHHGKSGCCG